jgi:citrate synthase
VLGARAGWGPTLDITAEELSAQTLRLGAVVPTVVAAAHRLRTGQQPVAPRDDLGHAANLLWMVTGVEPTPAAARALEQYLVLTVDHGFNASTFAARVITSTGADLASAIGGAIGALSGPLHGGAPSRALEMLDVVPDAGAAQRWVRDVVASGGRVMGFGHRVYSTDDPRSVLLRQVAQDLGGPRVAHALGVESAVVRTLAELKPGRQLYTNVEFYAGVVMEACGLPRELFTPTFAASRTIGWSAHIEEQAADNRLIRPSARYVGPPAPQPVPVSTTSSLR